MMMSMAGKKGSMVFSRSRQYGYLADAAGIVNGAQRPAFAD
jgi:hypothetical protein